MVNLKKFLSLANAAWIPQSKYKVGFGLIFWDKKSLTFVFPIYSTIKFLLLDFYKRKCTTWVVLSKRKILLRKYTLYDVMCVLTV